MKKYLALFLAMIMAFSLVACGGKQEAEKAPEAEKPSAGEEAATGEEHTPVTIEAAFLCDNWVEQWETIGQPKWEAEYPWITVVPVGTGPESGFMTARVAANDIPDITWTNADMISREMVEAGLARDLKDTDGFKHTPASYTSSFTHNDVCYGITQGTAFACMFVNMAMLKEAGWDAAPTNFQEWMQCCADIDAKTDYGVMTVAGNKTTTAYFVFEGALANAAAADLAPGQYEEMMKNGEFDFMKYPEVIDKMGQVCSYMIPGTATNTEDDVAAMMADGAAAMALAGNWTASQIIDAINSYNGTEGDVACVLVPFHDEGETPWISVSPETGWGISGVDEGPEVEEARLLFFNWLFEPENFAIMQNARGTIPVLDNFPDELTVLPDAVKAVVPEVSSANTVLMSFNVMTGDFQDLSCTLIRDVMSGNLSAESCISQMNDYLKQSYVNMG